MYKKNFTSSYVEDVQNIIFICRSLKDRETDVKLALEPIKVLAFTSSTENEIRTQRSEKTILSGIEAMTIILGCVIFLGAFTAAICVACFNRKKFVIFFILFALIS